MKQQGSLITTLLVILESIAVVGFLFLIFAVSSSSNIGKYEYRFQIKSNQGELQPLAKAVIWAVDQEKQLSFHTDDQGISHFRTIHPLDSVTVSATNHFTQSFFVDEPSEGSVYESTLVLKTVEKETVDTLTQTIKTVAVIDEQKQPITNALVTLISETPAQSFQYDLTQEAYPLLITDLNQEIRFSVSAPGYVPQFDVAYNETSPVVALKKQPNLNFPYEFKISVYDANKNADFSALDDIEMMTDAVQKKTKKALDGASLFVDQGAVIKNALGSFQIFSRIAENVVEIHAPQYVSQNLTLIHEGQEDNHYRVFLNKDEERFIHKIIVNTHDNNSPISTQLQTDAKAAIQKKAVGVYQIHTSESELRLTVEAAGYISQEMKLSPEEQTSYHVAMQPIVQRTYSVQVSGREEQPIVGAVVTILGNQPQTTRTNEEGIAILKASDHASKALLAAPGYITQTVELPSPEEQEDIISASYQLKVNPMSDIAHTIRVNVLNEEGKLLTANVSGSAGFVSQEKAGVYKILSPTLNLKMNVSAPGYQDRTIWFSEKNPRDSLTIMMKKLEEQVDRMTEAAHTIEVNVLDEVGNPLGANVASTTGFVTQEDQGTFKIYSSTYDMQVNVSAPGYEHHTVTLSQDDPQDALTIALKKIGEQVGMMASAKHTIQVKVTDEQGDLLAANVGSNTGFVTRKTDGTYQIFSPIRDLKLDVSALGYEPQTVELSEANSQDSLIIALKKIEEQVDMMASAKQTIQVQVTDEQGELLEANVASSAGFVTRKKDGTYQIFSPIRDLKVNVSAPGYQHQSLDLSQKDQTKLLSVMLKKVDENIEQMSHATHMINVKILDEKGELIRGNVASSAGFVNQKVDGIYQIFSPTRDLKVNVSAPGYQHQTIELSEANPQNLLTVALKKTEERVDLMSSANHTIGVKVIDEKGKLLAANLASSAGFVTRKADGTYQIFSPTRDLKVDVSAKGFQPQTVALEKSKNSMTIKLKEVDKRIHQMSDAAHEIQIKVLDEQGKWLGATVASSAGFVMQEHKGAYKIYSPTYDMRVNVSAPGYQYQTVTLSKKNTKKPINIHLKKVDERIDQMSEATHMIQVKVLDEQGKPLGATVASTAGFVMQEHKGAYKIFSPTYDMQVNVSAPGYQYQTVPLSEKNAKKPVSIRLKKVDERIDQMSEATHMIQVNVLDEQGKPLGATVASTAGFVTQGHNGSYKIFSPTYDMRVNVSAPGYQYQTVPLSEKNAKKPVSIRLKKVDERIDQMSDATHTIKVKVLDDQGKPLGATVASTAGFVNQGRNGTYKIFSPTYDMQIKVSAPGYEHHLVSLSSKKPQKDLTVALKKTEKGVVLNTEVGDRLILSKGVVYRVIQPIDKKTVKVYRRTDPNKGEFNDYPEGKIMSLAKFNREIELEKNRKNFFDENVWVTVYALDRNEYFLFKDTYRKQWSDYKLVYANHR